MWANLGTLANLDERKSRPCLTGKEVRQTGKRKAEKRKNRPRRACKDDAFGHKTSSIENRIFIHSKVSLERAVGSVHCLNIKQWKEGVKKEQVKGCGSVNRPTPGSQRPAEPVATGLLQGVKTSKNRGQFSGLGVKRWVVDARFSQRRAILYGVTIGVTAISCFEQGKQSARLSAVHFVRGRAPDPPLFFLRPYSAKATSKTAPHKQRKEILKTPRPRQV